MIEPPGDVGGNSAQQPADPLYPEIVEAASDAGDDRFLPQVGLDLGPTFGRQRGRKPVRIDADPQLDYPCRSVVSLIEGGHVAGASCRRPAVARSLGDLRSASASAVAPASVMR